MKFRLLTFVIALCSCSVLFAQKAYKVHATETYYMADDMTPLEAKAEAVARARIKAIAQKFGIDISQITVNTTQGDSTDFRIHSATEIGGTWLADTKEPIIKRGYDEKLDQFYVKAKVWGKVCERKNDDVQLNVKLLANSRDDIHAKESFNNNDRLRISFTSPVDGYVAMFYIDNEENIVYPMVPNPIAGSCYAEEVKAKNHYLFLDAEDEITYVSCSEQNRNYDEIIVLFSPNRFSLPCNLIEGDEVPMEQVQGNPNVKYKSMDYLKNDDFQKWLIIKKDLQRVELPIALNR